MNNTNILNVSTSFNYQYNGIVNAGFMPLQFEYNDNDATVYVWVKLIGSEPILITHFPYNEINNHYVDNREYFETVIPTDIDFDGEKDVTDFYYCNKGRTKFNNATEFLKNAIKFFHTKHKKSLISFMYLTKDVVKEEMLTNYHFAENIKDVKNKKIDDFIIINVDNI